MVAIWEKLYCNQCIELKVYSNYIRYNWEYSSMARALP